jgi:hypothetical protein
MVSPYDNDTDGGAAQAFKGWLLKNFVSDILAIGNIICKKNISRS